MKSICGCLSLSGLVLMIFSPLFGQVGGISGKVVYAKGGVIKAHVLGDDTNYIELGPGDFARWSPDGQKVAVKAGNIIYVVNADGSGKIELAADAEGDKNCPLEFHTNGKEVLYIHNRRIMAVNIATKEKRVFLDFVKCSGEIGMAADKNRVVCRDGHILRAIDLDSRNHTVFHKDNCSAAISPDGNLVTHNDNGVPHHLNVYIRKLNASCTQTKPFRRVSHRVMPEEIMGDNHHWSNHNDWITCEGDKNRNGLPYMINIATQKGYVMVNVEGTKYPDLWVDSSR